MIVAWGRGIGDWPPRSVRVAVKTGQNPPSGGVAERLKAPVLKTGKGSRPS